jgi:hypothetical protein
MKPHAIILLMVLMSAMVAPAMAADYNTIAVLPFLMSDRTTQDYLGVTSVSHDASTAGKKIALIQVSLPRESTIDFTLYYGNGSTVSGSMSARAVGLAGVQTEAFVSIGSDSKTYTFLDTQPVYDVNLVGYATRGNWYDVLNVTQQESGFLVYSIDYAKYDNDLAAFYSVSNPGQNTIYKITMTSTRPFQAFVTTASAKDVEAQVAANPIKEAVRQAGDWVSFAIQIGSTIYTLGVSTFYWLKFFFWDNILLTICIYIVLTGAVAVNQSKDIFQALGKFFRYQKTLFEFIIGMWQKLIDLIATFRGIFRI